MAAKRLLKFLVVAIFSAKLEINFLTLFNSLPLPHPLDSSHSADGGESTEADSTGATSSSTHVCNICQWNDDSRDMGNEQPSVIVTI